MHMGNITSQSSAFALLEFVTFLQKSQTNFTHLSMFRDHFYHEARFPLSETA